MQFSPAEGVGEIRKRKISCHFLLRIAALLLWNNSQRLILHILNV